MIICEKEKSGLWNLTAGRFHTAGKSKAEVIEAALKELESISENDDRGYVACSDGTVFAIYWGGASYGYDIVHPGIGVGSNGAIQVPSSVWGNKTFAEAVQNAKTHAEDCFGGVVPGKVTGFGGNTGQTI
jgi:hypothetical protein